MADLTDEQLLQIIADGESDSVEFKESLSGDAPKRIREAICAFANDLPDHRQPGYVLVGVDDDGQLVGGEVTDGMILQLADMKTDGNILPPPSMTVEKRVLKGKQVAVVTVQVSDSPPVRCHGAIRIRIGSRRGVATAQDERILNEKRRYRDRPYDLKPISDTGLSDLDLALFEHEYLPQAFSPEILADNQRSLEERLVVTKMIESLDQPLSTILGLLVLGKDIKFLIPGAYIQFLRIGGNDWSDPIIDEVVIRGNIGKQIQELDATLRGHNRKIVEFVGIPREKQTYLYPPATLEQITRNAVLHRTYEGSHSPVYVRWFNDRIEVTSPGGPVGIVTPENFGKSGFTDYRNPNLADAMRTLQLVQRFGQGFDIASRELEKAGNPPLLFKVDSSSVRVIIKPNPHFFEYEDNRIAPIGSSLFDNGDLKKAILDPHEQYMLSMLDDIKIDYFTDNSDLEIYTRFFADDELTKLEIDEKKISIDIDADHISFYLPFSGNRYLLLYRPSRFSEITGYPGAKIQDDHIVLKLDFTGSYDISHIKGLFELYLDTIKQNIEQINKDIESCSSSLREQVFRAIQTKRNRMKSAQTIADELGFPLRQDSNSE